MVFLISRKKDEAMRQMMILIAASLISGAAYAQDQKRPVIVENAPTLSNFQTAPYKDYSDQGRRMYENNSQFYNKDNIITNAIPVGNGDYTQPGNSNPINQDMYEDITVPSGTIYSGYIPVRQYGTSGGRR
jgi:hypothetical protein